MSIEGFVNSLRVQLRDLNAEREKASGSTKGSLTRKINEINAAITKAERKGIT